MKTKKILVCGRGYSFKYYNQNDKGYDLKVSYNHPINSSGFDYFFFSKSKEKNIVLNSNVLTESSINNEFNIKSLEIGNTTFGLYQLLFFISKKYSGSSVDLVGFDFRYIYENETDLLNFNFQSFINIESQKIFSNKLKSLFKNIIIRFIGFEDFSDIDPKSGLLINKNSNEVEIVAEITTNHFGNTERLEKLINCAKIAGADSVKLQMRDVRTFYTEEKLKSKFKSPFGNTFLDYRLGLELSDDQILFVDKLCKKLDINYFFSVLDQISFQRILDLNPKRIKLPSTISNHKEYIEFIFQNFKNEIVVSTGMTDQKFIDFLMSIYKNQKLYLLHCISSYPVNIFHSNLQIIKNYSALGQNIIPGYSSHDIGYLGSMFAVFSGAKMIEKHIKDGNSSFAHFDETALDVNIEFPEYVQKIRSAEQILGSGKKVILNCEHHKY